MTVKKLRLVFRYQNSAFEEDDIVNLDVKDEGMICNEDLRGSRRKAVKST
jgi:hypothetical protein